MIPWIPAYAGMTETHGFARNDISLRTTETITIQYMLPTIQKIIILAEARIPELMKNGDSGYSEFYEGSETFVRGIEDEMEEMQRELKSGDRVFLEDELGDIFWDYICLLENLEHEGKISKAKVFERCWTKFSERLNGDGSNNGDWYAVKKMQKERLEKESSTNH